MKALVAFLLLVVVNPLFARIGETPEEIGKRFGKARKDPKILDTFQYSKGGIAIRVTFVDGLSVMEKYTGVTSVQALEIMEKHSKEPWKDFSQYTMFSGDLKATRKDEHLIIFSAKWQASIEQKEKEVQRAKDDVERAKVEGF